MRSCLLGDFVSDGMTNAELLFCTFEHGGYVDAPCPPWCLWPLTPTHLAGWSWLGYATCLEQQLLTIRHEPDNVGAWLVAFRALRSCVAGQTDQTARHLVQSKLLRDAGGSYRELEELAKRGGTTFGKSFTSVVEMLRHWPGDSDRGELRLHAYGAPEANPAALRLGGAM
jgi:hypothetical protein